MSNSRKFGKHLFLHLFQNLCLMFKCITLEMYHQFQKMGGVANVAAGSCTIQFILSLLDCEKFTNSCKFET